MPSDKPPGHSERPERAGCALDGGSRLPWAPPHGAHTRHGHDQIRPLIQEAPLTSNSHCRDEGHPSRPSQSGCTARSGHSSAQHALMTQGCAGSDPQSSAVMIPVLSPVRGIASCPWHLCFVGLAAWKALPTLSYLVT